MPNPPQERRMAYYAELSQVGMEMAAPIGVGALIDYWRNWSPWCTIVGAVLGLALGLFQLVRLGNRESTIPESDSPDGDLPGDQKDVP